MAKIASPPAAESLSAKKVAKLPQHQFTIACARLITVYNTTMSKPRKTPVPLPGSKSKTPLAASGTKKTAVPLPSSSSKSAKKKAAAPGLSQEFVGESDDSSDEAATAAGAQQQNAAINIAVHRPKPNGAGKTATEAKKKQKDAPKTTAKQDAAQKKPAPKQVTREEDGADTSTSEESSDDEETDIKQAQQRDTKRQEKEDTDSSSDDSSDDSDEEAAPAAQRADARPAQAQTQTVTFQQARPYVPPEDFKAVSTERAASSTNTNMFKNLNGKQIWHITAPEGVSLKDLTHLAMDKVRNGEAVLDHKGAQYGFSPVENVNGREVMIPGANGYKAGKHTISKYLLELSCLTFSQCLHGYRRASTFNRSSTCQN